MTDLRRFACSRTSNLPQETNIDVSDFIISLIPRLLNGVCYYFICLFVVVVSVSACLFVCQIVDVAFLPGQCLCPQVTVAL